MNNELKIIVKAVTDSAKKSLRDVNNQLKELEKGGKGTGASLKAMGKVTAVAGAAMVGALAAVGAALINLGKSTQQFRAEQAKLNTAFMAAGSSAEQAAATYSQMFRFLGDSGKATEAAAHLAKITTNQKDLAQWTKISQGIYATFGDSLPIEGLTEAANETLRVGKVTGTLADALNWAGVSEDEFNNKLASTLSFEEREKMLRETLNGLYEDAANIYEKNNAALLAYNESQAKLDLSMAQAGNAVQPLMTAVNNLGASFFNALTPALNAIIPYIAAFVDKIAQAVNWVLKFFNVLSGGKSAPAAVASGMGAAATGAKALTNNTNAATKAAEKLKRTTAGFDELNIISNNASSASGGGAGSGAGAPAYASPMGGMIDTSGIDTALGESESKISGFIDKIKKKIDELKTVFQPTIDAWVGAFNSIDWATIGENFMSGFENIKSAFTSLGGYIFEEFIPSVVNSFSENLAPVVGDVFGYILEEGSANFSFLTGIVSDAVDTMIIPALELIKTVANDVFDGIGKAWGKYGAPFVKEAKTALQGIRDTIQKLYDEVIKPVWDKLVSALTELWQQHLKPLWDNLVEAVLEIQTNLLLIWNKTLKPIVDWLIAKLAPKVTEIVNKIIDKVKYILATVSDVVNGAITIIRGIVNVITGVFTKDWKKAWEGVKQIFKGIFDSLWAVVKVPLNAVIGGINTMIGGIVKGVNVAIRAMNKLSIKVPDWVPEFGGKTFGFNIKELSAPKIPALATGGIVVSETLARIGEGGKKEAVLPLEQNNQWMDMLADKIAARNSAPSRIVLMLDKRELGWANINSINDITKQTGTLQLTLA